MDLELTSAGDIELEKNKKGARLVLLLLTKIK